MTYLPPALVIETELGPERQCRGCGDFWPIDEDFWYFQVRDGKKRILGRCRACQSERPRDPLTGKKARLRPMLVTA